MSPAATTTVRVPTRDLELELLRSHPLVAGMDEVGRGALAGPVSVGVAVVTRTTRSAVPTGLADSKLVSPRAREELVRPVREWCAASAVGHAEPGEIDRLGIVRALRLAGRRALAALAGHGVEPGLVLLDGVHDWLSEPAQGDLFALPEPEVVVPGSRRPAAVPPVRTEVKADATCAVVAAASVLAKVERDAHMCRVSETHPAYRWAENKGYSSPAHVAALREHGPCEMHRRSWRLPGLEAEQA